MAGVEERKEGGKKVKVIFLKPFHRSENVKQKQEKELFLK